MTGCGARGACRPGSVGRQEVCPLSVTGCPCKTTVGPVYVVVVSSLVTANGVPISCAVHRPRSAEADQSVPKVGIEPTLPEGNRILSPARLPVPPLRRDARMVRGSAAAGPRFPSSIRYDHELETRLISRDTHASVRGPANYLNAGNFDAIFFWTALVLVLITIFCSARLRDSRLGRAWVAIREDETAAAAMGIPLMRTKTWAYATGAFFGGVAGAYYASYNSGAFPDQFYFNISVFILCMVILGGMGNIWGVLFGASFLAYLKGRPLERGRLDQHALPLNIQVPNYEFGIYGAIIVIVMLFRPEGLIPSARRAAEFHEGVHDEPLYDIEHDAGVGEPGAA